MGQAQPSQFIAEYDRRVATGDYKPDAGQRAAAQAFDKLFAQFIAPAATGLLSRLMGGKPKQTGLYVWGDVGRGKSMLMDLFVEEIKKHVAVRRVHFHAFMLDVHKRLHAFRQLHAGAELMDKVIAEIADETKLLCLDELQVTDVTDAMILARLFSGLMDAGVTVVFTSNRPPHQLYQHGLQREQFMAFIELLKARVSIVELKSPTDYRLEQWRQLARTYVFPRNAESDDFLVESWQRLTHGAPNEPLRIEVQGRTLRVDKHAQGIAWLTFGELCMRPLGANDYLALARICHTLLLQGIPAMTREERNEAKRFVTLIDALYDHRVKFIATAEVAPDALYPAGDGSFEFARTASRLHEMQSEQYLALAHIAVAP